ncbi:MAG: monovalent cation/H(+) antiporter subunit G [Phycisphaerae bacterium]
MTTLPLILDLLTVAAMLFGLFFMFIGALGLWRFPDLYNRMHAASKCITLGISGLLLAVVLHLSAVSVTPEELGGPQALGSDVAGAVTKALIVIIFQFVAAPVAAHMLSRAAHMDNAEQWQGTLSDDLIDDHRRDPESTAPQPAKVNRVAVRRDTDRPQGMRTA